MEKVLVLIEAVGKIKSLSKALKTIGVDADIIATKGHLFANPQHLFPVGVNENFEETSRSAINQVLIDRIKSTSGKYNYTIIATDPDQEGEVIAEDLADILYQQKLLRVYLKGLDPASVRQSFRNVSAFRKERSWSGTCRRIVDRVIGATFTNQEQDVQVGRVQSALLGALHQEPQVYGHARFTMPDGLGGQAFEALVPVTQKNHKEVLAMIAEAKVCNFSSTVSREENIVEQPWNYAECISNCAEKLKVPIVEIDRAMQRLYENGELSYLRSSAHGVSKDALKCLAGLKAANGNARNFDAGRIPMMSQHDAHESPRPLVLVNTSLPVKLMDFDQAVLALISRQLIKCGTPAVRQIAKTDHLPTWAKSLPWQREMYPRMDWQEPKPAYNQILFQSVDVSLMRVLNRYQLGQPGTQVDHALRFMRKNLHGVNLVLNERGLHHVRYTPKEFLDPANSPKIEKMISIESDMPPSMRAAWIMAQMGDNVLGQANQAIKSGMHI